MSGAVIHFTKSEHRRVQESLPWFLIDTLDDDERLRVEQHLAACAECRADLEQQRGLRASLAVDAALPDIERALVRVAARLDGQAAAPPRPRWRPMLGLDRSLPLWAGLALSLQFIVLAGLTWSVLRADREAASFHTLAAAGAPLGGRGNLVVVFDPQTRVSEVQEILAASRAHVVDGPLPSGAYVLDAPPASLAATMTWLQAQRAVTLAAPLTAPAAP